MVATVHLFPGSSLQCQRLTQVVEPVRPYSNLNKVVYPCPSGVMQYYVDLCASCWVAQCGGPPSQRCCREFAEGGRIVTYMVLLSNLGQNPWRSTHYLFVGLFCEINAFNVWKTVAITLASVALGYAPSISVTVASLSYCQRLFGECYDRPFRCRAHIPHHTTLRIPSRNLHEACASLQINWDMHLNKADFDVSLKTTIGTQCNLFDDRKKRSVKFEKASRNSSGVGLITVQKSKSVCMG
uniref:Uncharacterized protein n=1 Tax=Physcomitrium patens TaxID=3218 RepID=A0A2K1KK93_PHYPA|nr:hypothetical protein PHYPA_007877 [Physcomitrium patens]